MQGLRKPETNKFNNFFELVQKEAAKKKCVFFLDSGQGKFFENEDFECMDLCGWLIPEDSGPEFEPLFKDNSSKQNEFDDFFCFIDFEVSDNGKIKIEIEDSPNDLIIEDFNILQNNIEIEE